MGSSNMASCSVVDGFEQAELNLAPRRAPYMCSDSEEQSNVRLRLYCLSRITVDWTNVGHQEQKWVFIAKKLVILSRAVYHSGWQAKPHSGCVMVSHQKDKRACFFFLFYAFSCLCVPWSWPIEQVKRRWNCETEESSKSFRLTFFFCFPKHKTSSIICMLFVMSLSQIMELKYDNGHNDSLNRQADPCSTN